MNVVLILSGGVGRRLGGGIPKQYIEVCGKPVIAYCLKTFQEMEEIGAIQIVAEEAWRREIDKWVTKKCRGFSTPGETRQMSILNGLRDILDYAKKEDVVIIHDAARPLVSKEQIRSCIEVCTSHDGAMPALFAKDTMYLCDRGKVTSLLGRERLCAGQAPEAYLLGKYYEANQRLLPDEIMKINGSTEAAFLAEMDVALVDGDERNFKITTPEDLERFRRMVEQEGRSGTV